MGITTEFQFTLPEGYVDKNGVLHKAGVMRLATAADEVLPLKDPRVQRNPAYSRFIVLSRVIVRLGGLRAISAKVVEGLYASDVAYLESFYNKINGRGTAKFSVVAPSCRAKFEVDESDHSE
jgi:hypothetical protein